MRKLLIILLAFLLLFFAGACSVDSGENDSNANDSNEKQQTDKPSEESSSEVPEEKETTVHSEEFSREEALVLEQEFEERLYQETIPGEEPENGETTEPIHVFDEVKNFSSKEKLTEYLAEILDRELAEYFVDSFYEEDNDKLYLIPKDGPIMLLENEPFELEETGQGSYELKQQVDSEFIGEYLLTITYDYDEENSRWIIRDRAVDTEI